MVQSYFVPPEAHVVVLTFLATFGAIGMLLLAAAGLRLARRRRFAVRAAATAGALAVAYAAVLIGLSVTSQDRVLQPRERKYFCEIDCHLAYSVERVERTRTLGASPPAVASGVFYAVTLQTWFDPATIAPWRGNAELVPTPRRVYAVDRSGRRYSESRTGLDALARARDESRPLSTPLRPGEWYETRLVFDLPTDVDAPLLLLATDNGVEVALLGHENSPWHGKIYFDLSSGAPRAGS